MMVVRQNNNNSSRIVVSLLLIVVSSLTVVVQSFGIHHHHHHHRSSTTSTTRRRIAVSRPIAGRGQHQPVLPHPSSLLLSSSSRQRRGTITTTTTAITMSNTADTPDDRRYTIPDQPARYARAKTENNERYLDITSVYDPTFIKGLRIAVTGANRGIGLALAKELTECGANVIAIVRSSSTELEELNPIQIIKGIDVTNNEQCEDIKNQIEGGPIDVLINNAGYFMEALETIDNLCFDEQMKTIDICACGPLRVSASFLHGNLLKDGSKIIMITSQGGSIGWRPVQNPGGTDYGHHMSKAAANMMSVLLALELKEKGISVGIFHPGFNKTGMTAKYKDIWEIEGAVDAHCGAKRIMYEVGRLSLETSGKFINCEDGLEIPW